MARKQRLSNQAAVKAAAQPQSVPPVEATEHQSLRQRKPQQQQQQQQRKTSASTPTMADDLPKPKRSAGRPRKVPIAALVIISNQFGINEALNYCRLCVCVCNATYTICFIDAQRVVPRHKPCQLFYYRTRFGDVKCLNFYRVFVKYEQL